MKITRENTTILKVVVKEKVVLIDYATVDGENVVNGKLDFSTSQRPIHKDFKQALNSLNKYVSEVLHIATNYEDTIMVYQVKLSGDTENLVRLTGKMALLSGNSVDVNTDNLEIDSMECPYNGFEEFKQDIGLLLNEAFAYCFEDKQSVVQMKMDFLDDTKVPGGEKEAEEVKEVVKKKGKGKKKDVVDEVAPVVLEIKDIPESNYVPDSKEEPLDDELNNEEEIF